MIKSPLRCLFVIFLFGAFIQAKAQDTIDIKRYSSFFQGQVMTWRQWLKENHLEPFIMFDRLDLDKNKITLSGKVTGKLNWDRLKMHIDSLQGRPAAEWLFEETSFIFDHPGLPVEVDQILRLVLESKDISIIIYQNIRGEIVLHEIEHMGVIEDQLALSTAPLLGATVHNMTLEQQTDQVLKRLSDSLPSYFQRKDQKYLTWIRGKSEIDLLPYPPDRLVLKIKNIKGVVLKDGVSWEYVKIKFHCTKNEDYLVLNYVLDSKYYDGGFFSPSSFVYYRPVDDATVEEYHDEFKSILWQLLKK